MNNKLKKGISGLMVGLTACFSLSIPAVSYAEESYEDNIYASSFSDYTTNGLPAGWVSPKYIVVNKAEVPCTNSDAVVYDEDGNKSVKMTISTNSTIKDIIPFNKVVSSGKLHISFDYKMPRYDTNPNNKSKAIVTLFNTYNPGKYSDSTPIRNYDPKDVTDFRGFVGLQTSQFLRFVYTNAANVAISQYCQYWDTNISTGKVLDEKTWYHIDMVVDIDNNFYDVWVDGERVTANRQGKFNTGSGKNAFKGLGFLQQDSLVKEGYYDNVFVTNYNDADSVKLVTEYLSSDETSFRADVAFSEYLERAPENGDFVITDDYTGDTVDYEVESGDGRHAVLKVDTDKAAKLNIAFSAESSLCGTISSTLSDKSASVYSNIKKDGTVIPVLNEVSAADYDGNDVILDGSEIVPIGTTAVNVSFSTPVALDGVQDKVYIENIESGEKLNVDYTIADDNKSVKMDFAELMNADSEYRLVVESTVSSLDNDSVFLPHNYEFAFTTSNDGGFGIFGDKIVVDEDTNTATFVTNIIKSDENTYKGTIILCGYATEENDGVTYTRLAKIDVQKYDIDVNSITAYSTNPIDITGLDRIRCYINDTKTNKIIFVSEKEL